MENFCTENENMPESWTWVDVFWVAFAGGVWCDDRTEQMHILYVQNITRLLRSCACDLGKHCWRHLRVLQAGFWIFFNILPSYLHQCFLPTLTFSLRNQALADASTKHVWPQRDFSDPASAGGDVLDRRSRSGPCWTWKLWGKKIVERGIGR